MANTPRPPLIPPALMKANSLIQERVAVLRTIGDDDRADALAEAHGLIMLAMVEVQAEAAAAQLAPQ
jgi:hypothetical protein